MVTFAGESNNKRSYCNFRHSSDHRLSTSAWRKCWKHFIKNSPVQDFGSTRHNWRFCQLHRHMTKIGRISDIRPDQIYTLCPSLRIRGPLPDPIVNGGIDSFWKRPDFQLWRARDLDLGSGHTAYHRASVIDLYLRANFTKIKETFWGQMDGRKVDLTRKSCRKITKGSKCIYVDPLRVGTLLFLHQYFVFFLFSISPTVRVSNVFKLYFKAKNNRPRTCNYATWNKNRKLSYCRGTAWRATSADSLTNAAKQHEKSYFKQLAIGEWPWWLL